MIVMKIMMMIVVRIMMIVLTVFACTAHRVSADHHHDCNETYDEIGEDNDDDGFDRFRLHCSQRE